MDPKEKFRQRMREMNERDLADAIAESNSKTLSQRAEEAIAWYLVALADMVRRARDEKELEQIFARDRELPRMRHVWDRLHNKEP